MPSSRSDNQIIRKVVPDTTTCYRIIKDGKLTAPVWYPACTHISKHGSVLMETEGAVPDMVTIPGSHIVSEAEIFGPATPIQAVVLQQLADTIGIPYDGYNCLEIKEWQGIRFCRGFIISCYEDYIRAARSLDYIVGFADPDYVQAFLARLQLLKAEEEQWYAAG